MADDILASLGLDDSSDDSQDVDHLLPDSQDARGNGAGSQRAQDTTGLGRASERLDLQPGHDTSVPRIALAIPGSERPERPEVLNQAVSSSDVDSCESDDSDDSDDSDLDIDALLEDISENHSPPNGLPNDLRTHVAEGQASSGVPG